MRFFVTSLGNPRWVVERVSRRGRRRLPRRDRAQVGARRAVDGGVHGLIARERPGRAGTRAARAPRELLDELRAARPAGRVRRRDRRRARLRARPGAWATRARSSARASSPPPSAGRARPTSARSWRRGESDIVLTERLTGVPVAVIDTPDVRRARHEGRAARALHAARPPHEALDAHGLRAALALAAEARPPARRPRRDYWQAGKSVAGHRRASSRPGDDRPPLRLCLAGRQQRLKETSAERSASHSRGAKRGLGTMVCSRTDVGRSRREATVAGEQTLVGGATQHLPARDQRRWKSTVTVSSTLTRTPFSSVGT